jgi:putative AdoMet-dependent methyltransferase
MTNSSNSFPASEFDAWADDYDQTVPNSQAFPFTGYQAALEMVVTRAEVQAGMRLLDLGTGTGNLALRFAALGCELWCSDFSEAMLAKARLKLPSAQFLLHDLRTELPVEWAPPFERIVSAYVFHHFPLDEKVKLIERLLPRLTPGGRILIADIAFPDATALENAKAEAGDGWDEEYYWVADESVTTLQKVGMRVEYTPVSNCTGVFTLQA